MNRALFLDRDGVINEDYGYVHKIEDFHIREGIFDVCRAAQEARMKIVVVTNQAGIGRGFYSKDEFLALSKYMTGLFFDNKIDITDIIYCPYHPTEGLGHFKKNSFFRKPKPGMIVYASNTHNINLFQSIMIGDSASDKVAAYSSGIKWFVDASKPRWPANTLDIIKNL